MEKTKDQWLNSVSRRNALRGFAGFVAASPLLRGQEDPFRNHSRAPGINELTTAFDFEEVAYAKLRRDVYDFMMGNGDDESTFRRNRIAFDWVSLVSRGVADVRSINTATEIFGQKMRFPILISPTAGQGFLHDDGEKAMHQGATAANVTMIVNSVPSFPIEEVAAAASGPLWFQIYRRATVEDTQELIQQAQAAGCKAIAWTVDGPVGPYRQRVLHNRHLGGYGSTDGNRRLFSKSRPGRENYGVPAQVLDWKFLESFRPAVKVPLLLKGVIHAEDADLAARHGLDGIIVSNHGARRVGHSCSSLEVLPEIVDRVAGRIPVLVDSGFRRGSDVLKALALGADAVCLGRVPRWGLAAFGAEGVQRILEIVQAELLLAMANTGRSSLAAVDRSLVRTSFPWA
jgi:isopentenyl diphosphate isomerase/L-lactate dehydrogenase-like FMN-dependent dehydrogenase